MKIFFIVLFLFLKAFAEDPSDICDQNILCTQPMLEIANGYKSGSAHFSQSKLSGFSGSCYYISSLYDSNHEHHGAFLFERQPEALVGTGIFSFFTEQDPYQNMNSLELKEWFINNQSGFAPAIESSSQIELRYLSDKSDFHYWFRSDVKNEKLFVIGQQFAGGQSSMVFCEMTAR